MSIRSQCFLVAAVLCLLLPGTQPAHGQATDADGSIVTDQWLALGPFATPIGCDSNPGITGIYGNQIGPVHHIACEVPEEGDVIEGYDPFDPNVVTDGLHPDAPQDADGNPMWYAWDDGTPFDGVQNFDAGPLGDLTEHMMYLATYVEYTGPEPVLVEFCFGSDDDGQVWIDDRIVHNVTACRGTTPCEDRFFASIAPGVHVIKMAAWEQGGGFGAVLGMNVDGFPVQDGDADWVFLGREGNDVDLVDCSPEDYEVYDRPSLSCLKNEDGSVDLTWVNDPETDPDGMITIIADGVEVATLPGGTERYTIPADVAEDTTSFCVRSAGGLSACSECTKVSAEGLITTNAWIALGPFNGPGCEGTRNNSIAPSFLGCEYPAVGDELLSGYDPLEAASDGLHELAPRTADGEPIWYAFDDGTDDGDQDFNLGSPEPDNVVQYAVTYVEYTGEESPVNLNLCIGSDDTIDIWINGERVFFLTACRGRGTCQETVPVTLPGAGVYRIAVGVWDGCCGWGFSLGLQDEVGDPILEDHPDWTYHGRARPADLDVKVPGGIDCPSCAVPVENASCKYGPVGFGEGLVVSWEIPDDCECLTPTELKINGEIVATVPADAVQAGILQSRLPDGGFDVTITNCSGLFASCSPFQTDDQGLILTQAWTAIGPFNGPGCNGTQDNSLAPSFIGCEYPEVGDELLEGYDPVIAASGGVHDYAPVTPDGDPLWYAFDDGSNNGDQNFNLGTPEPDNVVQYAVTYIEYTGDDNPVNLNLCIGSDDSIDIWINAERVFFLSACRGRGDCQNTASVTLPGAGVYRIAVGVWDGCCGWGFRLGLQDDFGLPIIDDGLNEEWVFHGRDKPEGFEGPCPSCILPVTNLTCDRGANGLTLDWENSDGCDNDMRILLYGEEIATVPPGTTSYEIPAEEVPLPGTIEVDNGALETAQCSFIEETDEYTDQGFIKTWLMLGPFEQPSGCCPDCLTAALDYLTDGDIEEADILPQEDEEIDTDFGGTAASTGLAATPGNPDLNPNGIPTWNAHTNFDDTIDYNGEWYLGDPDDIMVYSAFYVDVPEAITVDIGIGSDDTIQVLVDGEEAGCFSGGRGFGPANEIQNVFPDVQLSAGQHLIMIKVFDGCCGHGHRLRFERNGSALVPGEISLEPEDSTPPGAPRRPGDVNGDSGFNIADMVAQLNFLFGGGGLPECYVVPGSDPVALNPAGLAILDYNGDGSVNIADAVAGLGGLFGGGGDHVLGKNCVEIEGSCDPKCVN